MNTKQQLLLGSITLGLGVGIFSYYIGREIFDYKLVYKLGRPSEPPCQAEIEDMRAKLDKFIKSPLPVFVTHPNLKFEKIRNN